VNLWAASNIQVLQHGPGGGSGFDDVQQATGLRQLGFARERRPKPSACAEFCCKNFEDIKS